MLTNQTGVVAWIEPSGRGLAGLVRARLRSPDNQSRQKQKREARLVYCFASARFPPRAGIARQQRHSTGRLVPGKKKNHDRGSGPTAKPTTVLWPHTNSAHREADQRTQNFVWSGTCGLWAQLCKVVGMHGALNFRGLKLLNKLCSINFIIE